jgi:hypothetical protein
MNLQSETHIADKSFRPQKITFAEMRDSGVRGAGLLC